MNNNSEPRTHTIAETDNFMAICFDGFALGFPWYGVFSCAALAAFFLALFVWIGMGNDAVDQQKGSV